jgi:hypothetical protein
VGSGRTDQDHYDRGRLFHNNNKNNNKQQQQQTTTTNNNQQHKYWAASYWSIYAESLSGFQVTMVSIGIGSVPFQKSKGKLS